jgi:uncharacterized protein (DUF58 family)
VPETSHRCSFPAGFIPVLDPGVEQRVELTTICPRRGRIRLRGIRVSCGFPFGLFTCHVDIDAPADLIVYPAAGRVRREFWYQQAMAEAPGSRRAHHGAGQDEFHGVREYRHGDNPRWIHWRRSAHTGELVVREHQTVRDSQVIVLLDPWVGGPTSDPAKRGVLERVLNGTPAPSQELNVERIISAAATAVCEALDRGHRVGLIARGARAIVLPPAGGQAHRRRVLSELALLEAGGETSLEQLIRPIRWAAGRNVRCLLLAARGEETHSRMLRALSSRSQSVLLVSPQSGWLDKLFDISAATAPERRAAQ